MSRKIGLTGIPQTSSFAIQVAQQGRTAAGSTDNWGGGDNPWGDPSPGVSASIRLVKRSNLQVAPEGMFFEVDLVGFDTPGPVDPDAYDPQHHDVYYFWNFGDPGSTFTATENVMDHQRDANVAYGPTAAHVYSTHGDYQVSVLVVEPSSGKTTTATFEIGGPDEDTPTIQNPDDVFANGLTIIVDQTGAGLPQYPNAHVRTTIEAAFSFTDNKAGPYRVMLMDDQEWDTAGVAMTSLSPSLHVVGSGTGSLRPKLNHVGGSRMIYFVGWDTSNVKDAVISGISFEGGWDSTTETGTANNSCFSQSTDQGSYLLVTETDVMNFGAHAYVAISFTNELGVRIFHNLVSEGSRSYHFYEEINAPCAYLGVRAMSNINALSGGPRLNGPSYHNDAAILRFQSAKNVVIDGCDIFVRTGWFENMFGIRTQQAAVRFDQRGNRGTRFNVQRCSIEGSLSIARMNNNVQVNVQNNLIERCVLAGTAFDRRVIVLTYGGATIRNNLMSVPNAPRIDFYGLFNPSGFVQTELYEDPGAQTGNVAECAAGPIKVYNNTCVSLMDAAHQINPPVIVFEATNLGTFTNIVESNNILHAPATGTPSIAAAPLVATPIWTPRHNGYRSKFERIEVIIPSDVTDGASITLGYPTGRGQSDYAVVPDLPHRIGLNSHKNANPKHDVPVTFGSSSLTVVNDTGTTWPAGEAVIVLYCPDSPATHGNHATNNVPVAIYRPDIGSPALGSADDSLRTVGDFFGNFRPVHQSMGAFEADL
ncbi:hypothetical protein AB3Y40_14980 [Yoonia sp. R2331]|uniref:hypothetical protein n=1 Tax=Yoonia sp. R2331 TaxID=3237238 RepID=UPI0034E4980F